MSVYLGTCSHIFSFDHLDSYSFLLVSSWNQNLSVVRPSSALQLYLNLVRGFLSRFSWLPLRFPFLLRLFSVFVNMVPYGINNFKTTLFSQIAFQILLNFLLNDPHMDFLDFWNFEFPSFPICFAFVKATPLSNHFWYFFSTQWDSQNCCFRSFKEILDFWKFAKLNFNDFFRFL